MSNDLMISETDLLYLIRSSPYRYKVYKIDKRKGDKKRIIAQPAREVKALQYWVMKNILSRYSLHSAAMAYRQGKSIADNAQVHAKNRFLLKLDFKDFFHSITGVDFKAFMVLHSADKFNPDEIDCLARILFWKKKRDGRLILSIGAPSSPILSNILMYEFDKTMREYCMQKHIRYTRYADDLTFSTNAPSVLDSVVSQVVKICQKLEFPRLRLNHDKTVRASKAGCRRVTGLVLSNDATVSIGRDRKRQLHAAVHHYVCGKLGEEEIASLSGMLAFVRSIDPGFLTALRRHYGRVNVDRLLKNRSESQ
jgi:retron-type reverse transcriptase